jgi:hypothetical protein
MLVGLVGICIGLLIIGIIIKIILGQRLEVQ